MINYARWTQVEDNTLRADILGADNERLPTIEVDTARRTINLGNEFFNLTPDEARLIGVRLIDAAVLADGDRVIRQRPTT